MEGKWNELNVDGPDARVDHDMVLDSSRNRVVLFGGYMPTPGGEIVGDTWEWDGRFGRDGDVITTTSIAPIESRIILPHRRATVSPQA